MSKLLSPTQARALYRSILRAHRTKLTPVQRQLGDAYVREEFRRHRSADAKFLPPFFVAWQDYLAKLNASPARARGTDLAPRQVVAMSDEQRQQLQRLRQEAMTLRGGR